MKRISMLLVCLLTAATAAAATNSGTWVSNRFDAGQVWLALNFEPQSNLGLNLPLTELRGLTADAIASKVAVPVTFSLDREAGVLSFEGTFRDGRGSGVFDFKPRRDFSARLASLGIRAEALSDRKLLLFTAMGLSLATVREVQSLGYQDLDVSDLEAIVIHRITPAFIREMRSLDLGPLSLDDLLELRIHGASPQYVRDMIAVGFPRPDKAAVVSWRIHGVTADYVREMRALGIGQLSNQDLLAMKIHGVTPAFVREVRSLGYDRLTADELTTMRIHGITTQFIRDMRQAGYADATVDDLVRLRIADRVARKHRTK